jgi:hypothetical protein
MIRRGSIVCDKADPRHVGRVESITWRNMHTGRGLARVRWLETGWQSTVLISDLREARDPRAATTTETNLVKRRLRDD